MRTLQRSSGCHRFEARRFYGQRAQSEMTNSVMKRKLGDSLRSTNPERPEQEM